MRSLGISGEEELRGWLA